MDEQVLLKYNGPALDDHRMDVRDLAPALMGLADAIQAAGKILDASARVRLDVKATYEGSFEIDMLLGVLHEAGLFLGGGVATAWANGISITDAIKRAVMGAIAIAARITKHGGKPVEREVIGDGTQIRIQYPDGSSFEADNMAWAVFSNGKVMTGLEKVVEPLREGAIDSLALTVDGATETVRHDEREGFSSKYREELLADSTTPMILELVDVNFKTSVWRVSDGDATYSVDIEDADFLDAVEDGTIRFGNGDSLRADVRTIQRRVNVNLRSERTVVKVHEVIQRQAPALDGEATE
ncbi:hypothetical protein [Microbacterium oxydans]|uniref:hypothetical protein n=1 Tax=Microbacterium oxydans TaxID=82380 RepID=UPI0024AD75DB|nr:hypothetical protein [Microbacterium oxydans]